MSLAADRTTPETIAPLREAYHRETPGQIVHDSLHCREGWTAPYLLLCDGETAGYASVAVAGPWNGRPTVFELYVAPQFRTRAFALFECFLAESGARHFEVQTNDRLLTVMLHVYGRAVVSEKIVFEAGADTALPSQGAILHQVTPADDARLSMELRRGSADFELRLDGAAVGTGSILFHYNRPYADLAMEVAEAHRRRGHGAFLVQELKRECRALGHVPGARCNLANVASRSTLQKAGLIPCGHMLVADIAEDGRA